MPTPYTHPHHHVQDLLDAGGTFVLTKKHWNGFSSDKGLWQFIVLNCGPEWLQVQAIHNSARPVGTDEHHGRPLWISWKDFGSFGIERNGEPV